MLAKILFGVLILGVFAMIGPLGYSADLLLGPSQEAAKNPKIQNCYEKSDSGKEGYTTKVIANLKLAKDGHPTLVAAIENPEQSGDAELKGCVVAALRTMKFPEQAQGHPEIQIQLNFPMAKSLLQ
jgi:hypothetical protein